MAAFYTYFTASPTSGWAGCTSSTTSNSTSSWGTYTLTDYQREAIRNILLSDDDDVSRAKKVKKEDVDALL